MSKEQDLQRISNRLRDTIKDKKQLQRMEELLGIISFVIDDLKVTLVESMEKSFKEQNQILREIHKDLKTPNN